MPKYTILTHKRVDSFLENHREIAKTFLTKLQILSQNPYDTSLDTKKLKWKKNIRRLRISKYRFLYSIEHKEIVIFFFEANSRGDIYS